MITPRKVQTSGCSINDRQGAIFVNEEHGASLVDPPGSAHMVIVSHGDDGKGAYTEAGQIVSPCTAGAMDSENCDDDGVFISALRSVGSNAFYFDDIVVFRLWTMSNLWSFTPSNPDNIYNRNPGNVGIGTDDPQQRLDVEGSIRAVSVHSSNYCDRAGTDCFPASVIGGAGIRCTGGNVMTGIRQNAAICSPVPLPPSFAGLCPSGQFVRGIQSSGGLICGAP